MQQPTPRGLVSEPVLGRFLLGFTTGDKCNKEYGSTLVSPHCIVFEESLCLIASHHASLNLIIFHYSSTPHHTYKKEHYASGLGYLMDATVVTGL